MFGPEVGYDSGKRQVDCCGEPSWGDCYADYRLAISNGTWRLDIGLSLATVKAIIIGNVLICIRKPLNEKGFW